MTCLWACETDPFCRRVYRKHWPETEPFYDDIRSITDPPHADLLCGGFPCQDLSAAGKRAGITGERSGLWSEFARLIGLVRPRYVLIENVPGLLVRGMERVLFDLSEIGYDAEWESIPAAAFGAPHIRDRVWILACATGGQSGVADQQQGRKGLGAGSQDVADANNAGSQRYGRFDSERDCPCQRTPWACCRSHEDERLARSGVRRISHGIPNRVDRLKSLGNAVVPAIVTWLGKRIMDYDAQMRRIAAADALTNTRKPPPEAP